MDLLEKRKKQYRIEMHLSAARVAHAGVTVLLFWGAWMLFRYQTLFPVHDVSFRYNYFAAIGYLCVTAFLNSVYNAYMLGYFRVRDLVFSQFLTNFFAIFFVYFGTSIAWNNWKNPTVFLALLFAQGIWDCLWSCFGNWFYFRLNQPFRSLVLYADEVSLNRIGRIQGKPVERRFELSRYVCTRNLSDDEVMALLPGYEAVFLSGLESGLKDKILKYCLHHDIRGFCVPHIGDLILQGSRHLQSFSSPLLNVRRAKPRTLYLAVKRGFDILASLCGLVILSPLMLVTALAIHLTDGGPAIYKQIRLTMNGRQFKIYKFRSMRVDAEKNGAQLSTGKRDSRITPIGRIIRACRIDELPQLVNILKGDMSIVGPRPERPEISAEYEKTLPDFPLRLQVRAGLTGYAQVYGRYNTLPYEKLEFDLLYINQMNALTDLELMFATIRILFSKESTEGFENGTAGKVVGR